MSSITQLLSDIAICSVIYAVIYFFQNYLVLKKFGKKYLAEDLATVHIKAYAYGCLADVISILLCAIVCDICSGGFLFESSFITFVYGILYNVLWILVSPAFFNLVSILLMLIPILVSAVLRFIFYYFIVFKETKMNSDKGFKNILIISVYSAPYYFLVPMILVTILLR